MLGEGEGGRIFNWNLSFGCGFIFTSQHFQTTCTLPCGSFRAQKLISIETLHGYSILRPHPHVSGYFLKQRFSFSVLAFRPHINSILGHQKRFLKTVPRVEFIENAMCGHKIFWKQRKKSLFSKISGYAWTEPQFTLCVIHLWTVTDC